MFAAIPTSPRSRTVHPILADSLPPTPRNRDDARRIAANMNAAARTRRAKADEAHAAELRRLAADGRQARSAARPARGQVAPPASSARRGASTPRRVPPSRPPTAAPAAAPAARATTSSSPTPRHKTFGQIARACYADRAAVSARRHGWSERVAPAAATTTTARTLADLVRAQHHPERDYTGELVTTRKRGSR